MKAEIARLKKDIKEARRRLLDLQKECVHRVVNDSPDWPEAGHPVCELCGKSWSVWYCPPNPPTHRCAYTENYDSCDHCGEPMERK